MTFGATKIDYSGAGPLAVMTAAFVAAICWKKNDSYSVSINTSFLSVLSEGALIILMRFSES